MSQAMSGRQRFQLARALANCDAMSQADWRDVVVSELQKKEVGAIPHSHNDKVHILKIIDACLGSPRGITPLIEVLRNIGGETARGVREVEDVLASFDQSAELAEVPRNDVVALIRGLGLPEATLRQIALDCLEVGTPQQVPREVGALIDHLASLGQQGHRPFARPVLEFVERVAQRPEAAAVRARLKGIVAAAFTPPDVSLAAAAAAPPGPAPATPPAAATGPQLPYDVRDDLRGRMMACPVVKDDARRKLVFSNVRAQIWQSYTRNDVASTDVMNMITTCLNYAGGIEELVGIIRREEGDSLTMKPIDEWVELHRKDLPKGSTAAGPAPPGPGPAAPSRGRTLYVLVDLRPEWGPGQGPESPEKAEARYYLDVWVCQQDGTFLTDSPLGDPETRPRTLPAIKADFMERVAGLVDPLTGVGDELRIELLLPRALRYEGFDQWVQSVALAEPVGWYHPVAVRCRERMTGGRLFGLRPAWEGHGATTLGQPPEQIKIIPFRQAADLDDGALFDAMFRAKGRFCLVVAATPADFADPELHAELLQEAVKAGMAAGLWIRDRTGAADAAGELIRLFEGVRPLGPGPGGPPQAGERPGPFEVPRLGDLPECVWELRRSFAARTHANHLGNHLTLFWDDPGRVPPSLRLGAPRGRGIA